MNGSRRENKLAAGGEGRRRMLKLGGLGLLGMDLAGLLRTQAAQAAATPGGEPATKLKACILIFYYGGPSHLDTVDMKPNAPVEVRGEYQSIATSAPGVRICEHLPLTAKVMHKVAIVRSMHHAMRFHDSASFETLAGRTPIGGDRENIPDTPATFPCHGSALSYLRRHERRVVPHAVLPYVMNNEMKVPGQSAGFLGPAYEPFLITGDPDTHGYRANMLDLPAGVTVRRLEQRSLLRRRLNGHAPLGENARGSGDLDQYYDRALDLLSSERVRRALDINREDTKTRRRYGLGPTDQNYIGNSKTPGGPQDGYARNLRGQNLLLARRLVEAGVPFVNVYDYKQQGLNWDCHANNFELHKQHLLPAADRAFSALVDDLDDRGLLESTLVVALGEFGRTPKINKNAGRDHWPDCYSVLLAGGGVKGGMVYGSSDKVGAYPDSDGVTPGDLAATLFWRFGIDPAREIHDAADRPWRLAMGRPLSELFG